MYTRLKTMVDAMQGSPLLVINEVITLISRIITPVTHLFSAIYRGHLVFGVGQQKVPLVKNHFPLVPSDTDAFFSSQLACHRAVATARRYTTFAMHGW